MLYLEFIEIMSSCTSILGREKCSRFDIEKLIFATQDEKGAYSFKYKGSKSNEVPVYLPVSQAIRLINAKQKDEKLKTQQNDIEFLRNENRDLKNKLKTKNKKEPLNEVEPEA